MDERDNVLREVGEKWDSLYRHKAWEGLSDDEVMRQFDQYIQKLTLPLLLNDKFPPSTEALISEKGVLASRNNRSPGTKIKEVSNVR